MSKQTAVDVYHDQIKYLIKMGLKLSEPDKTFLNSAYRDCKAMEREQIIEAVEAGYQIANEDERFKHISTHGQYYNETYKGGEQ